MRHELYDPAAVIRVSGQVTALTYQLMDVDLRIDRALDQRSRRDFRWWCKRRATLATRLQTLLLTVAIS